MNPTLRRGFTLVEILITITIIGILAGAVLAALQSARETAKAAKTKATITKLHYVIMERYDSYRTRRVPVNIPSGTDPKKAASVRLYALRDLMRMEMPDRWSDVNTSPIVIATDPPTKIEQPSVSYRYQRLYVAAETAVGTAKVATHAAAECLYMIVMSSPEAAEQFQNTEIGDVDDDGLKEFIDGWGHPIRFIRWPTGFVNFEILQGLKPTSGPFRGQTGPAGSVGGPQLRWDSPSDLQSGNRQEQPDPFDTMSGYDNFTRSDGNPYGPGFAVFPLIYSAGPDGIYDINIGLQTDDTPFAYVNLDYYQPDANSGADVDGNILRYIGQPLDAPSIDGAPKNDQLDHYDNIHNHRLEVR